MRFATEFGCSASKEQNLELDSKHLVVVHDRQFAAAMLG